MYNFKKNLYKEFFFCKSYILFLLLISNLRKCPLNSCPVVRTGIKIKSFQCVVMSVLYDVASDQPINQISKFCHFLSFGELVDCAYTGQ